VARNKTAVKKFIVTLSDQERGALTALIHTGKHPAQRGSLFPQHGLMQHINLTWDESDRVRLLTLKLSSRL